ncbi:hypothetical protein CWS31_016595 [Colwellia echini]|uniref:Transposase DDE domain-containing protein n=1 Tax=Colwellia echini TaxID=1982103 RepID=A0ABY3MSU6_9GAMM|nr:hypothetical protein CWS31_016595 [Colwellia echini]
MIKAHLFIQYYSLKNRCNDEYDLLRRPQRACLETFYAALLISTRKRYSLQSMPCLKTFLLQAESCILKWLGYNIAIIRQ